MNTTNLTRDIIGLEKKYWQAMVEHDMQTALSLTDFPCVVAGPQGVQSIDKAQFEKMFNSHDQEEIKKFDFVNDPEVRQLSDDSAVVAYKTRSLVAKDGKEQPMEAIDTSTWIKRDNKWLCAMHTEIPLTNKLSS